MNREWICPQCGGKYLELVKVKSVTCTGNATHKRCAMVLQVKEDA